MLRLCFSKRVVLCALSLILSVALIGCGRSTKKGTEGLEYEAISGSYVVTGYHGSDVHVVIPDTHNDISVTGIAEYAFENSEIQSVTIGKNVTHIDSGAFACATLLKEVYIPASVDVISGSGILYDEDYGAFENCISLEKVTIEKGSALLEIGCKVFDECESLKEIILPDGLQRIDKKAFSYCVSLKKLIIPATVEYVGDSAFSHFTDEQEIVIKGSTDGWQQEVEQTESIMGQVVTIYPNRGWDYECDAKIVKDHNGSSFGGNDVKETEDGKVPLFGKKGVYLISKKTSDAKDSHKIEKYSYSDTGEWEATECNLENAVFKYNDDGYLIKETYYTDALKETVASYVETIRDDHNRIIKLDINYCYDENENGIFRVVQNYSFYEDGTMKKYTLEMGYCKNGQWAQGTYVFNENKYEYEYKDGKIIVVHEIPTDSSQSQYRYEYEYDSTGLLKCRTRYSIVGGVESVVGKEYLSYDVNGNVVTIMDSDFEFSMGDSVVEYEYTYFNVKQEKGMFGTSEEVVDELMFLGYKFLCLSA